jgi:hypothetical protein
MHNIVFLLGVFTLAVHAEWSWKCVTPLGWTMIATNGTHVRLVGTKSLVLDTWTEFHVTGHATSDRRIDLAGKIRQTRVLEGRSDYWSRLACESNGTIVHTVAVIQPNLGDTWWCGDDRRRPCETFQLVSASVIVAGARPDFVRDHSTCSPIPISQLPAPGHACHSGTIGSSVHVDYGGSYSLVPAQTALGLDLRSRDDIAKELMGLSVVVF